MNEYKWMNNEQTMVKKFPDTFIQENGSGWEEFQQWVAEGGIPDPWKTRDELEAEALVSLWLHHDQIIVENGVANVVKTPKQQVKYNKVLRKESKGGTLTPKEETLLEDNDVLDDWFDDMERAAEDNGEQWIEDPGTTDQELIDFDPSIIAWPDFPF